MEREQLERGRFEDGGDGGMVPPGLRSRWREATWAAGEFTRAGGIAATNIAKWNGSGWSALGSGIGGSVFALAVSGSDLYAGGIFTTAGGIAAPNIATWNGSGWSALGSGMDGEVLALAVSGSDLYAGGDFTAAGGKVSANVARAYLEQPALAILRSGADVTVSWPSFYGGFVLEQNPDAANSNNWSTANYPLTTNGAIKSATVPLTTTNQFFRLVEDRRGRKGIERVILCISYTAKKAMWRVLVKGAGH
jgi:hypothetical protein